MDDDRQLLQRWGAGDADAGKAFVERYFKDVFGFVRSKVASGAEDLTQQVFAACVAHPERYRAEGTPRAFVLGIARRVLWKYFRSERRRTGALAHNPKVHASGPHSPSSVVGARDEVRLLQRALQSLPLDQQILIELQFWQGLTMRDIAEVMEIPVGTVKSRLGRAREALRAALEAAASEPELAESSLQGLDRWASELRALQQQ
ncbi:MAG: RNA polymerase sigma factor [Nannocystales bacterium]